MEISVTKHGAMRMRKRTGINKHAVERMATKVYEAGTRFADTKGRLHRYIESIDGPVNIGNELVVYGQFLYIFRERCLITVWPLPNNHRLSENVRMLKYKH